MFALKKKSSLKGAIKDFPRCFCFGLLFFGLGLYLVDAGRQNV